MDRVRPRSTFTSDRFTGDVHTDNDDAPVDDATWYVAEPPESGLVYDLPEGALTDAAFLTADFLLDGERNAKFMLSLHEGGDDAPTTVLLFGALPQCEGRIRLPLGAVDGSAGQLDREGAWCKPTIGGEPVDPAAVERIELTAYSGYGKSVRWCQTPLVATTEEPSRLADPTLPEGPLLDEFGQSAIREWEGRTESETELVERLREQRERAEDTGVDGETSGNRDEWGGWTDRAFEATGYFRTEHDGDRWWLITPDGHPFWSAGLAAVSPNVTTRYDGLEDALEWLPEENGEFADAFDHWGHEGEFVNFQVANLIRAFGSDEWRDAWTEIAFSQLREFGFNTAGNWSDWERAREAGVPYVRPLYLEFPETPTVFRDFPDVYCESFLEDAAEFASDLAETADDPAMIGYFLGNEPGWSFAEQTPAAGMLQTTEACETRRELADWLEARYGVDGGLAEAWEMDVDLDDVVEGEWTQTFTDAAREDLQQFSAEMVDRLYGVLSEACREVDPNHLILGCRFGGEPEEWELAGMDHVDVVTINCYQPRVPDRHGDVAEEVDAPILIGEWHFCALDAGLPSPGLVCVPDQDARGDAYRVYLEHAAANPWCVGAHYFTMYDQSALGRFDGENSNMGLLDLCNRPYEPLVEDAQESQDRLYDLAVGNAEPYDDEPDYMTLY